MDPTVQIVCASEPESNSSRASRVRLDLELNQPNLSLEHTLATTNKSDEN